MGIIPHPLKPKKIKPVSQRDYFAGLAMTHILGNVLGNDPNSNTEFLQGRYQKYVRDAFELADIMCKESGKWQ